MMSHHIILHNNKENVHADVLVVKETILVHYVLCALYESLQ